MMECVFTGGDFKGNGFIYKINKSRTSVRLLEAFEISESGNRRSFYENADMFFISYENEVLAFADTRLEMEEGIVYTEKLDLSTLTSATLAIDTNKDSEEIIATNSSKCRYNIRVIKD